MPIYLLDTDHISLLQNGHEKVSLRFRSISRELIFVPVVSYEEQLKGRLAVINKGKTEMLGFAYLRLQETHEFYCVFNIAPFDQKTNESYLELRKKYRRLGTMDLRIAATAQTLNAILVTRNLQDFEQIENLKIENWA